MRAGHFKQVCGKCGIVIAQCRCMDCNKTVVLSICDKCKAIPAPRPVVSDGRPCGPVEPAPGAETRGDDDIEPDTCHHGVTFDEECEDCELETAQDEEAQDDADAAKQAIRDTDPQAPPALGEGKQCTWTLHEYFDDDSWETSCGEEFIFNDGTPEENGVKFCHHCGKEIEIVRGIDEPDEDPVEPADEPGDEEARLIAGGTEALPE